MQNLCHGVDVGQRMVARNCIGVMFLWERGGVFGVAAAGMVGQERSLTWRDLPPVGDPKIVYGD